jgi:Flp pilus assembly protein TadG
MTTACRATRHARGDSGAVSTEVAVLAVPCFMLLTLFLVFCGRSASAVIDANAAAAAGARAAADAANPATARTAAAKAVAATAAGGAWRCATSTDTSAHRRGGQVTVRIACAVPLSDLGIPGIGTTRPISGSATEPVDTYRATP